MSKAKPEDVEYNCKVAFLLLYDNTDQKVSSKEKLTQLLQYAGRNPTAKMINKYWRANTVSVTFKEFCDICRKEPQMTEDDLLKAFKKIDTNKDGFLTVNELQKILTSKGDKMTLNEVRAIIDEVDENKDGKLDYSEFCKMIMKTQTDCQKWAEERVEKKLEKSRTPARNVEKNSRSRSPDDDVEDGERKFEKTKERLRRSDHSEERERNNRKRPTSAVKEKEKRDRSEEERHRNRSFERDRSGDRSLDREPSRDRSLDRERSQDRSFEKERDKKHKQDKSFELSRKSDEQLEERENKIKTRPASAKGNTKDKEKWDRSADEERTYNKSFEREHDKLPKQEQGKNRIKESREQATRNDKKQKDADSGNDDDDSDDDVVIGSKTSLQSSSRAKQSIPNDRDRDQARLNDKLQSKLQEKFGDKSRGSELDKEKPGGNNRSTKKPSIISLSNKLPRPKNIKEWKNITRRGCFYFDESTNIMSHHYSLKLNSDSSVYFQLEPVSLQKGDLNNVCESKGTPIDTLLLVLNETGRAVTITEARSIKGEYGVRCDLKKGKYQLIPFSSGCRLKKRRAEAKTEMKLIKEIEQKWVITKAFRDALDVMFKMSDLDGDGLLSRDEFNWFAQKTEGEGVDDEKWEVVEESVQLEDGKLTPDGFLQLIEMEAEDCQGDSEDLWITVTSMGFNRALALDEACPFVLNTFIESSDASISVTALESPLSLVEKALSDFSKAKGSPYSVKQMKDLFIYSYITDFFAWLLVENKSHSIVNLEIDCSNSTNVISQRPKLSDVAKVPPGSVKLAHFILPEKETNDWTFTWTEKVK